MLQIIVTAELLNPLDKSLYSREQICFYFLDILGETEPKLLESAEEGGFYILKFLLFEDIDAVELWVIKILHRIQASLLCSNSQVFVIVADSDIEALVEEIVKTCLNSLAEFAEDKD